MANGDKTADAEDKEQDEDRQTRTEEVVNEFVKKIKKGELKYEMVPEMRRERGKSIDYKLSEDYKNIFKMTSDEKEQHLSSRPLNVTEIQMHPLKKNGRLRQFLRVSSVQRLPSEIVQSEEIKPLSDDMVEQMKERDICVKLCDMGNACYVDKHYSDIIQTREYRSPEVILGGEYDQSADIWSLACMIFELVTGDYLFDPKKGKTYRKNDDHLALMTELIGQCYNRNFLESNPKVWKFYNKKNMKLKNISKLHKWPLYNVLVEKYRLKD